MLTRGLVASALLAAWPALPSAVAACRLESDAHIGAGPDVDFERFLAEKSPAIVTIKCVLKIEFPGQGEREQETEVFGVMMDPKGIVLCSNLQMGGYAAILSRRAGGQVNITPTKIKVLVGDDTEGADAKLVARDSELDLAWIRLDKPADKPYASVDFSRSAEGRVGEKLVSVDRLGKYFDRAPVVGEIRIGAIVKKPRTLLVPSESMEHFGVPLFSAGGQPVGFTVLQYPGSDDPEEGQGNSGVRGAVILPASEVVSATERAMKTADADKTEADKNAPKDATPAKDGK